MLDGPLVHKRTSFPVLDITKVSQGVTEITNPATIREAINILFFLAIGPKRKVTEASTRGKKTPIGRMRAAKPKVTPTVTAPPADSLFMARTNTQMLQ